MALDEEDKALMKWLTWGLLVFLFISALMMWGCPQYNVWTSGLGGEAELRRAEQNRKIAIEEARATQESAALLAEAEITRAEGTAKAQAIINHTLTDRYIQWMMAEKLSSNAMVIYVPTESQIPVLEATRLDARTQEVEE